MKIVIIIPTYNEADSIQKTLPELEAVLETIQSHEVSILIFDSHSTDSTLAVVAALQKKYPNILLQTEAHKSGLGSAYAQAMQYAYTSLQADLIFEFDADGSHQPKYIVDMIQAIEDGADVAVGSRYTAGGKVDVSWPWYRRLVSELGNLIARCFLVWRYKDFTSGFRASKASFLASILKKPLLSKNYAYKIHLLFALHQAGAKIIEVPITFIDRENGYSKFPKNNVLESLKVVFILRFRECQKHVKSWFSHH